MTIKKDREVLQCNDCSGEMKGDAELADWWIANEKVSNN
jgi:hypothetical protein